jgi:hypothetical protein
MEVDVKFQVPAVIENFEQVVTNAVNNVVASLDFSAVIDGKIKAAIASLVIPPSTGSGDLKLRTVVADTMLMEEDDVVVSFLSNDIDKVAVFLPPITKTKRVSFLTRNGGMEILPSPMNTIDGAFNITLGVAEVASLVTTASGDMFVKKIEPRKYDTANLVSDGIDTWYIM